MGSSQKSEKVDAMLSLSESQQMAIKAPIDQPLLILAAAGSGKTLVLCHRILHLLCQGVAANNILAVTFTRRAGQDLLHRLQNLAATASKGKHHCLEGIRVSTFHSFALSVLRALPTQAGLGPNFVIFTPKMQLELLQELVEAWYSERSGQRQRPANGSSRHAQVIKGEPIQVTMEQKALFTKEAYHLLQHLQRRQDLTHNSGSQGESDGSLFDWVYPKYCSRLREANAIDFNSFVWLTVRLLRGSPAVLQTVGLQAQFVLVDEFQDTDTAQFELLHLLCGPHKCLTIVGDDDQQIYSWRGAAGIHNLHRFQGKFPDSMLVKLEQNFRSTGAIVAAARRVINRNQHRMAKSIRTLAPTGALIRVCECRNEQCEAAAVIDFITSVQNQGIPLHDIVILYRLQRVGLELLHNLTARGLACEIKGSGGFPQGNGQSEWGLDPGKGCDTTGGAFDDVIAVLRLVVTEGDDYACQQLMNLVCQTPGPTISACLRHLQLSKGMPLLQAIKCTRSHLLGLLICEELNLIGTTMEGSHNSDAEQQQVLGGMHTMLRIVSAARDEVFKNLDMRDIVRNILQQIAPYREGYRDKQAGRDHGSLLECSKATSGGKLNVGQRLRWQGQGDGGGYEFAGIKALLKEAAMFDADIVAKEKRDRTVAMPPGTQSVKPGSYMDMKLRKGRRPGPPTKSAIAAMCPPPSPAPSKSSEDSMMSAIGRLRAFVDQVALRLHGHELGESSYSAVIRDEDTKGNPAGQALASFSPPDRLTLSTIHQAKGLEWAAVILVRANEGVLPVMDYEPVIANSPLPSSTHIINGGTVPNQRGLLSETNSCIPAVLEKGENTEVFVLGATKDTEGGHIRASRAGDEGCLESEGLEEERRLMYVALTRAKRFVMVTHLMMAGGQHNVPSRFLADIPPGPMFSSHKLPAGLVQRTKCYDPTAPAPSFSQMSTKAPASPTPSQRAHTHRPAVRSKPSPREAPSSSLLQKQSCKNEKRKLVQTGSLMSGQKGGDVFGNSGKLSKNTKTSGQQRVRRGANQF